MKTTFLLFAALILLVGCSSHRHVWTKPYSTQAEFNKDRYECVQESRVTWSAGGSGDVGVGMVIGAQARANREAKELFTMCMEARGWIDKEVPK